MPLPHKDKIRPHKAIFIGGPDGCAIVWDKKHCEPVIAALASHDPSPDIDGYTCTEIDDPISPNPAFPIYFLLVVFVFVAALCSIGYLFSNFHSCGC